MEEAKTPVDFFISYTGADRPWAEWIAWCLEHAGYTIIIQAWDFPAGSNFVYEMNQALTRANRVVAVLSPAYLASKYAFSEWAEAFRRDPQGKERRVLPVRVQNYEINGLLGPIVSVDLVGSEEPTARERLLAAAQDTQPHPSSVPFPGATSVIAEHPRFPGALPAIWNIPYPRNPVFTGREEVLAQLADALQMNQPATLCQPQAISGLGGIGKTQIAIEYAYLHRQDYQAVLWCLADTLESLVAGYVTLAGLLNLPQKEEQEQALIVQAVNQWLTAHSGWLLLLDNADDLSVVREFLPKATSGHILLTTRAHAPGRLAQRIQVATMTQDVGTLLLLRRAELLAADAPLEDASTMNISIAKAICDELGGLPLALDQAGAYIEETGCSLEQYHERYQTRRAVLLRRRGGMIADHPAPVATTWSLSFEQVEQKNPAAADLLRLCAFLHADALAEEIILKGAPHLGPQLSLVADDPLLLDEAIATLASYSLLRRESLSHTLIVHRLVQVVLLEEIDEAARRQWKERAVRAVHAAFPEVELATWTQCERCLPHIQICALSIEHESLLFPEAIQLFFEASRYLLERARSPEAQMFLQHALTLSEQLCGPDHLDTAAILDRLARCFENQSQYDQAEPMYERALSIYEQQQGPEHPDTAVLLNNLALLYFAQGKYTQAKPLLEQALAIWEQQAGSQHLNVASILNNLAQLCQAQDQNDQAESFLQRALAIREHHLGFQHPDTAISLNNLATFYFHQGKYTQAEPIMLQALAIWEQQLGQQHPTTAQGLNNLAALYNTQGKYAEAESLYERALAIRKNQFGPQHPDTAQILINLAQLYQEQGKYGQAESLMRQAISIYEQQLGPQHPNTAQSLTSLAQLFQAQGQYEQAESLYKRTLATYEQLLGLQHTTTAQSLSNLAHLYHAQGHYEQAELLYQRSLAILEHRLGAQHPTTAATLSSLASLYYSQGRYTQAEPLMQQMRVLWEQLLGPEHPNTVTSLINLGALYHAQGHYEQAEPLLQQALHTREHTLGPQHPDTAQSLSSLAALYYEQGRYEQAEPLLQQALAIWEQQWGPQHPHTAYSLNNLALLYLAQDHYEQAEPLLVRALAIREQLLGPQHPDVAQSLTSLATLYLSQGKDEQAELLVRRALAIREQEVGLQHPDSADNLCWLAVLAERQHQDAQADALYQQTLVIFEQTLGPQHPRTQQHRQRYASFLRTSKGKADAFRIEGQHGEVPPGS